MVVVVQARNNQPSIRWAHVRARTSIRRMHQGPHEGLPRPGHYDQALPLNGPSVVSDSETDRAAGTDVTDGRV